MSLSFRTAPRATRGAPWSAIVVFVLLGAALTWRATRVPPVSVPELVEVVGDVPRPGTYALVDPTLASAARAAGSSVALDGTPVPHGHRVRIAGDRATIEAPPDPVLVALPVDPNVADAVALEAVPGIGPATARAILEERAHGPFTSLEDLKRVKGIGAHRLAEIRPFLAVGP
ncbi:MAG: DUF655 domain-containing protein [Alphaproteobacteria bacterium]|nr:DUF655 domain-containing protein [Alphaproteobacteria bacterium]